MPDAPDLTERTPTFDDTLPADVAPVTPLPQRTARGTRQGIRALPPPIPPRALRGPTRPLPVPEISPAAPPTAPVAIVPAAGVLAARREGFWRRPRVILIAAIAMLTLLAVWVRSSAPMPGLTPETFVECEIVTTPPGATVTLIDDGDARVIGRTPLAVAIDPARSYEVVLAQRGHGTAIYPLAPNAKRRLEIEMAPAHGPPRPGSGDDVSR